MKSFFKNLNFWMIATFILGMVLIVSFFLPESSLLPFSEDLSNPQNSQTRDQAQSTSINTTEIYENLICACCGKSIAECSCGMAAERKAFVDGLVAAGKDEIGIYKEVFKKYGEEILADEVQAAEIKEDLIAEAPADRPIISVEPESVDLGDVSMAKGKVETIFKVKNVGGTDLEISGMETSCMCTTTKLKIKSEKLKIIESPEFGMHDNPTDWSVTLESSEEADLMVNFDPAHHGPEATGPVTRTISVSSSDPIEPVVKVQFEANVIK